MTDARLYLAIGVPTLAIMLGILENGLLVSQLGNHLGARITSVETRMASLETRFETFTGKVIEIDNRLTRLEERIEHLR